MEPLTQQHNLFLLLAQLFSVGLKFLLDCLQALE
jgi:hypothetical protein